MSKQFWMTWCESRGMPSMKHPSIDKAVAEATRIAAKERAPVLVLECVGAAVPQVPPIAWESYGIQPAAQPAQPAGEWPKWTHSHTTQNLRVWESNNNGWCWWESCSKWRVTADAPLGQLMRKSPGTQYITRAQAVALIGESAVCEGERLAGVAG